MTTVWPLRFRNSGDRALLADEAGGWSFASRDFVDRYGLGRLTQADYQNLLDRGHAFEDMDDIHFMSFAARWAKRRRLPPGQLNYLILVPTLRCNLACSYCQVSRAAESARGYDWNTETVAAVLDFINGLETPTIKIEFQGGEPLLRLDLLQRVRAFCRQRFQDVSFVVCSNFQTVSEEAWAFFDDSDTHLSTSFDGNTATHSKQRATSSEQTAAFIANLLEFRRRHGTARVSALPTVDLRDPPAPEEVLDSFAALGLNSIFLRPVNYQGFARRQPPPTEQARLWSAYHRRFVAAAIERNSEGEEIFEEFYLSHLLRRILSPNFDNLVDLRNPNLLGMDYAVVDFDGTIYPTDEARMMARTGQIDLSLGHVSTGLENKRLAQLNNSAFNDLDPDCIHCPFQPFCGTDNVDAISRYGRIDLPRRDTWFCQRQLSMFDFAFELLASEDPKVQHSLALWTGVGTWPSGLRAVLQ